MAPMIAGLGAPELIVILIIVIVLFGGARLAGLGKSTGRAIKEFKEETQGLTDTKKSESEAVDAEVVDEPKQQTPPAVGGAQPTQQNVNNSAPQPTEARRDN